MGKENVYVFDIRLKEIEPAIWRQVAIKADSTLEELSGVILLLFGWDAQHIFGFDIGGKEYGIPSDQDESEILDQAKVHLNDIPVKALKKFDFTYDFGDNWEHEIKLVSEKPADASTKYPICLAGERNGPPEDCGGVPGYEDVISALKAKKPNKKQKEKLKRLGKYDPEAFNIKKANKSLEAIKNYTIHIKQPEDPRVN